MTERLSTHKCTTDRQIYHQSQSGSCICMQPVWLDMVTVTLLPSFRDGVHASRLLTGGSCWVVDLAPITGPTPVSLSLEAAAEPDCRIWCSRLLCYMGCRLICTVLLVQPNELMDTSASVLHGCQPTAGYHCGIARLGSLPEEALTLAPLLLP